MKRMALHEALAAPRTVSSALIAILYAQRRCVPRVIVRGETLPANCELMLREQGPTEDVALFLHNWASHAVVEVKLCFVRASEKLHESLNAPWNRRETALYACQPT